MKQNDITHVVLVLDSSPSMKNYGNDKAAVKVADNLIAFLAEHTKKTEQETRITVYSFNTDIECLVYDMDVLRVPSIANVYKVGGWSTKLIDATLLSISDLQLTPEKYGDHAFLLYVITDGIENDSVKKEGHLKDKVISLPGHWTLAAFVPDQTGVHYAKKFGFPSENISVWDTTKATSLEKVGEVIRESTANYLEYRASSGTSVIPKGTSLFTLKAVSVKEIQSSLDVLSPEKYDLRNVFTDQRIDEFISNITGKPYARGEGYYELNLAALRAAKKRKEKIQSYKKVAILANGHIYGGPQARTMLGLPNQDKDVYPDQYPDYKIFVQSTADNRILRRGTQALIMYDYGLSRIG